MGDTQSAQRAGKDAAAEEESEKVNDGQTVQNTEDEPLKNNGQISEINGKADGSIAALNGHCEDKIPAEGNVAETEKPLKEEEETPLKNVEISQNKLPDEVDANEVEPAEIIEMEEKQNDINESFRKFFSNIGLKLTVKKGSGEKGETDVPKEGPNIPEEVTDNVQEVKSENEDQNVALNAAQEANDYDSTTCPTMTDGTSENFLGNAETKTTETTEEAESDSADAGTTSPAVSEDAHQDTIPEEEPRPKSPLITDEIVVESPFKRFFTTGIFSSLRKKKKLAEDEAIEKELVDMGENEPAEIAEQAFEEEQQDKEEITLDTEAITTVKGLREAELLPAVSIQVKDEVKSPSMDTSDSIVNEAEILNSQEKEKVQASPLKKLMSGSSFKNLSKKQKGKKSSDAKISDPQQQISDQLLSSTDSAEYQKEESPTQPSAPAAEDEDGAWAAFKKLVTPKKRIKKSSLSNEQGQISGSVDEAKLSEEQQISDHSTDEGKKRKDSSVSWEAVLCGSGRRRSRKSSDSEEETPQTSAGDSKQDSGLKQGAESPLERSNEVQKIQEGSPSEGDGESTWKSFKKLVTPKTKAKDEDESKDTSPSDDQVTQADSTFSIKKLLPGRKKRKPAEKPDQVSSDEADKDVASGDEDSETPAVIPLSEFDADETDVHTQTKTGVESYVPEQTDSELRQESAPPCDSLQIETQKVLDNEDALENEASKTPVEENTVEEPDDLTELISKYQQLSDIPEEGILTETMATPASVIEEAARDDTIAEDLVEITSEAITAPEPVDATATDETEMISAVSQLSDSSKTSGNVTPVPAEYSVKDTELLLEQVAENISASPHTVTVTSEEPSSERIVSSALPQILETFEKEQLKILEIHKGSDETVINTDLNTEPIDVINELAAIVQTESVPDVNKAISTEIVSQVHTEEFDNAEITVDEVHEVSVIQGQENIKELEATDDSRHVPESVSEEKEELPQETSPEGKEVVPDAGSVVGADQVEEDTLKTETQEAESASFVADENKNGSMEQEAQTPAEKRDQIIQIVTEESQVEDHASVVVVDELEAPTNVEKDAIASENDSVQSLEKETPSSEDIPPADVVTDESKQREHLTEVTVEPENTETQTEAPQIDHYEVTDVLEVEQKATVDTEENSGQLPKEEVRSSEDIPPVESTDESKQRAEHLTEVTNEPETKEPHPDISEVTDVSEVVQATLESEGDHVQKEIQSSEDIHSAEPVTDESKQTAEHLPEVTDEFQNKEPQVEVPEEIDVQAATLYPEERSIQSLDKEVISEDIPPAETDQPKETEMVPLTEDKVEAVDDSKTEDVQEPAVVQAFTLDSEEDSVQKEIKSSEDIPPAESIDESKQTAEHLTTVIDEIQNKEPQVEVPEEMEVVQAATFDSEERSIQSLDKEVISEDIPPPKTDQPKEAEMVPLTEDKVEAVDDSKTENVKEPAVVQAITVSEAGSSQVIEEEVISKDMVVAETVIDEPRQETVELEKVELVEAEISLPDIVPETDDKISKANVFAQSVEEICTQELETETLLEDVPKLDTDSVTDEAEKKVEAQPDQDLEINKDKKTESIPQGVRAEHEDRKAEAVEKTVTAAHVPSGAEASHDQVLEETVFCEEILAPCVESAEVSEEPKHEEDLSIDQVSVEGEKADELQGTEMNTAAAEHAVVMQVITYNLKDVSAAIPDVLIEETPEIQERSIERNANEMEVKAPVETTTPLEKDNVNNTAGEGSMVVMMHVPSVEFDDNHRIQVQVVDIAIKSAENIVDTMIEAGVTEAKEVIDVCHETLEKVETLSASPALEEEVNNEENNLTIQEVIQHVKENLPETTPESPEPDLLEQEVMKQADVSELVQSGSSELEDQKMMKDSAGAHMEEKDEEHVIPAEQKVSEAQLQRSDLSLEISTQDRKEDLEETKAELQKSEVCVTTEAATASSEKKTEKKVEAQPDQDLKINKDKKTESIPQGVQVEHEDRKAEAVEETVTAAHVPSGAEASHDQVLEETVFCEEILAPCAESAEVSEEPKHEEDLSIDQVSVEGEKADELQGTEMHTAAAEHAVVMQVITCNLKDVSAAIPDVLIEETPEIQERSIERNANEIEVKAPVETTTPLEKDNVNKTTGEGSMVVMMHVPSVEFDDNHRIQVQVVDIAIKSAENIVDTMIEAGVTEAKEVIDVCHETLEKVETLSASPALEEEVNNEENNLTIQEVIQHVKENLPETTPESPEPDLLEQEVMKKADVSELVQSGSSELEDQKMMKDSAGAHMEEKDEEHVIPAEQKVSEAQLQRSDLSLEISTQDRKEDLEETKAELQKSEVCVTTEAATASSEELSNKKDAENTTEGQRPQSTQSQIVTPSNTGLVAPQNTGMISSIGNVESPSSLSLEFKLNIQFGQPKAPASPPPPKEPMKQPDMSAVAVQAAEADDPTNVINAMQRLASEKQIELMEAAVQTTEITEPGAVISYQPKLQDGAVQKIETTQPVKQIEPIIPRNREAETAEPVKQITEPAEKADLTERAVMSYQPVPQDIGIQAMETIVPVEQIQSEQSIIPIIQAAEIIEPVRPKEKRGVLLSHPAVFEPFFEAHDKGKKAEEPIKQTDEENDDVWLDAEEDIYTQEETEVSRLKVEEPTEPQAESEPEFEMAPDSKTEDGESHQRVLKTGRTCELESEGEDFAVALEYPETTISVPPAEWD